VLWKVQCKAVETVKYPVNLFCYKKKLFARTEHNYSMLHGINSSKIKSNQRL
jgi:hypothetical protein